MLAFTTSLAVQLIGIGSCGISNLEASLKRQFTGEELQVKF
jgi:hypothetical protein